MDDDERNEELSALQAIYPDEIAIDLSNYIATLDVNVILAKPITVHFSSDETAVLTRLPPLRLRMSLPPGYPGRKAPIIIITSHHNWLHPCERDKLEAAATTLWEESGHGQMLYSYIDHVQQTAEQGLGLDWLVLPGHLKAPLETYEEAAKRDEFHQTSFFCGICLDPKRGFDCYRLEGCGHVFCNSCLQAFYSDAIAEGNVRAVVCPDATCTSTRRALHPRELLAMGLEDAIARRYVVMKRKKRLDADKTTIYCPRSWCQAPARGAKVPPIPPNLNDYIDIDDDDDVDKPIPIDTPNEIDRLSICEKCEFAFCRICHKSWHGEFTRCRPPNSEEEISAEDQASFDYIKYHLSACPQCSAPVQKTYGCNHMHCNLCQTHFCYLCSAWLHPANPYAHFNQVKSSCYMLLWEGEEGDETAERDVGEEEMIDVVEVR
ncbi:RWD-domain-containing protein [Piedraia hortae CBS 480.64]|uniref:RBR-type E3 ubiquitin transferase n=1 Tax=Piedraia hortae CBS 480.64 TaxID=1314780 RepID=A0A6A7BU67_9PEZI|nr:RWD-domain-containing protein [Piedraia hortae CBS 480.64]